MRYPVFVCLLCASALPAFADPCKSINEPCPTKSQDAQANRRAKIQALYNDLLYPTPLGIMATPPTVSVDNIFESSVVRGRVTPVGAFMGFESVREYFFALAAAGSRVEKVTINRLVSSDTDVSVDVDIFFCQMPTPCPAAVPKVAGVGFTLTQTGFFTFNGADKVIGFDLSIQNLGAAVDPQSILERETNIQQVCAFLTLQSSATSPGTCPSYFDSADDYAGTNYTFNPSLPGPSPAFANCVAFMHTIPYGSWNRANSNTFVCRQLHSLLTPFRPTVHCPHTSPTGGMTCIDFSYDSFYTTNLFDYSVLPSSMMMAHRH